MSHTWIFDAPTGTYRDHAMSTRIYEASLEESVFMDHISPVDGYGRKRGEAVTLTRVSNVTEPTSATLSETQRIPEDEFDLSTTAITVSEIGRAIPFTSLAEDLGHFDLDNAIQKKLRAQMTLYLDSLGAAAFTDATLKYVPTGTVGTPTSSIDTVTAGSPATTTAARNIQVWDLETIRDSMYDTYHIPAAENDDYIGIFRTQAIRGIKRDADWEEWHKYTDPSVKFNSEVGRMESIRFVETNHANALTNNLGSGSDLGEGVVFGEDSVAMAESVSPELRVALPQDFGRAQAVAWYGVLAFGLIWDTSNAGEARVMHVTSA